jgi:hypothetical protein
MLTEAGKGEGRLTPSTSREISMPNLYLVRAAVCALRI